MRWFSTTAEADRFLEDILEGTRGRRLGCFSWSQDGEVIALGFDIVAALERVIETRIDDGKFLQVPKGVAVPDRPQKVHWSGETDLLTAYLVLTGRSDPARGVDFLRRRAAWLRAAALHCIDRLYGPSHFHSHNLRLAVGSEVLGFVKVSLGSPDPEEARVAGWVLEGWETGSHPGWRDDPPIWSSPIEYRWLEPDWELEALLEDILRARRHPVRGTSRFDFGSEIVQLGPVTVPLIEEFLANRVEGAMDGAEDRSGGAGNILAAYLALTATSDPRRCVELLRGRGTAFRSWAISFAQNVFGPWLFLKPDYARSPPTEFVAFVRERCESTDRGEALLAKRLFQTWAGHVP